jgi:hypothetical protein
MSGACCPGRGDLLLEDLFLVVKRLEAGAPQNRLAQPLQAEDQEQPTDDQSQGVDRQRRQPGAKDRRCSREDQHRSPGAYERRAPASCRAHREHDRQGLDRLHRAGEKDRQRESELLASQDLVPCLMKRVSALFGGIGDLQSVA